MPSVSSPGNFTLSFRLSSAPVNTVCPKCGSRDVKITLSDAENPRISTKSYKEYMKCKTIMREGKYSPRRGFSADSVCPCCGGKHIEIEIERIKRTCKKCKWSWRTVKEWVKYLKGFKMKG